MNLDCRFDLLLTRVQIGCTEGAAVGPYSLPLLAGEVRIAKWLQSLRVSSRVCVCVSSSSLCASNVPTKQRRCESSNCCSLCESLSCVCVVSLRFKRSNEEDGSSLCASNESLFALQTNERTNERTNASLFVDSRVPRRFREPLFPILFFKVTSA